MSFAGFGPETEYGGEGQQCNCKKKRPVLSLERMLHKDYSIKRTLVVSLKRLGGKTN
jgi:hypothetical protein